GLGLTLSWGLLHLINIAYFGLAFLSAYLTYHLGSVYDLAPWYAALALIPAFFALGMGLHWVLARFRVAGLVSLLVTFGLIVVIEAAIQLKWTADFRKLELPHSFPSLKLGPVYFPLLELVAFLLAAALALSVWAGLRWTYFGKAVRASAEDASI